MFFKFKFLQYYYSSILFLFFFSGKTHLVALSDIPLGRVIYQKERFIKRTIKKVVPLNKLIKKKLEPIYLLSFQECKNKTKIKWNLPFLVCMQEIGTHCFSLENSQDEYCEIAISLEEQIKMVMDKIALLLKKNHDIIFEYATREITHETNFFTKKIYKSKHYYNNNGQQFIFQSLTPRIYNPSASEEFQKKIFALQKSLGSTSLVVDKYKFQRENEMIIDKKATAQINEMIKKAPGSSPKIFIKKKITSFPKKEKVNMTFKKKDQDKILFSKKEEKYPFISLITITSLASSLLPYLYYRKKKKERPTIKKKKRLKKASSKSTNILKISVH